jgi:subtilisin family serine protease
MKFVVFGQAPISIEFVTNSATSLGHSNAVSAAGVGATFYHDTPDFGPSPPLIESFSSAGGIPILLSKSGARLLNPERRNQQRFTSPDGGVITFFPNGAGGTNRFFGTSTAAPHVAAVAGLMLELNGGPFSTTPSNPYGTLARTAMDIDDPFTMAVGVGFYFGTGAGLVNAEAAVGALRVGSCGLLGFGVYWDVCLVSVAARILDSVIPLFVSLSFTKIKIAC